MGSGCHCGTGNLCSTGSEQHSGTFSGSGTGSQYIVKDQHPFAPDKFRFHTSVDAQHICPALGCVTQFRLGAVVALLLQKGIGLNGKFLSQSLCQELALIIASAPAAAGTDGHPGQKIKTRIFGRKLHCQEPGIGRSMAAAPVKLKPMDT